MDVTQAITGRRSIRGFKPEPVSRETLRAVLSLATRAVSAVNAQPWEFSVVSGQVLEAIRQETLKIIKAMGKRGFMLGADCTVPGEIDWARLRAAVEAAAEV